MSIKLRHPVLVGTVPIEPRVVAQAARLGLDLLDIRQAAKSPNRTAAGVSVLLDVDGKVIAMAPAAAD